MAVNTTVEVVMPPMGDSVSEGSILEWHKQEGDEISEDETLVEISTDKVDAEVPAPVSGTVVKIHAAEGDTVGVGSVLAEIAPTNGSGPAITADEPEADAEAPPSASAEATVIEIEMPAMGESVSEGTILEWAKQPGDSVAEDETIVEISTDKVDAEVPAPTSGTLTEVLADAGDTVTVGQVIARMTSGNGAAPAKVAPKPETTTETRPAGDVETIHTPDGLKVTPVAARVAAAHGVDLGKVTGTGPDGRIGKADVLAFQENGHAAAPAKAAPAAAPTDGKQTLLKGASAVLARYMDESRKIPTATSFRTFTVTNLDVRRKQLKAAGQKVSFTHLIAYAIARAATEQMPVMAYHFAEVEGKPNVFDDGGVNLGIAVDVEKKGGGRTLMVPVIKDAGRLTFQQFLDAFNVLIGKARDNKLTADDLQGANVSLTNPGGIGTIASVPRLMNGQGTIVATGSIGYPPGLSGIGATIGAEKVMTMTSTYDHRIIQGAESGQFLQVVEAYLQGEHGFYEQVFSDLGVEIGPAPTAPTPTITSAPLPPTETEAAPVVAAEPNLELLQAVQAAMSLIKAHRTHGHLAARLDPLGSEPEGDPALDPEPLKLTPEIMAKIPASILRVGVPGETLADVIPHLRETYCGTIAYEIEHIASHRQRVWLREKIETGAFRKPLGPEENVALLRRLTQVDSFERFMHKAYLGQKQFSIEGLDMTVPMLDEMIQLAAAEGAREVVIGMAHRGRLNVLAHNLGRAYETIFREFEGASSIEAVTTIPQGGTGDVKYHHGAQGTYQCGDQESVLVRLESNPSHLEYVGPVVEGATRAVQTSRQGTHATLDTNAAMPIILHGDAAFPGQGVVAETLNLQALDGYTVGGTLHLITNNQVGFTTDPDDSRSTRWASDLAKGFDVPIFHVNADDVAACISAVRLAFAFRQEFGHDVLIDLIGYRRYGHNEADEPAYTQPEMTAKIKAKKPVRELYAASLVSNGTVTQEESEAISAEIWEDLAKRHRELKEQLQSAGDEQPTGGYELDRSASPEVKTAVSTERLQSLNEELLRVPEGFTVHPKLVKQLERRRTAIGPDGGIDWAQAESLAYASLLTEGTPVRLTGQDAERGTFSQRHLVLHDPKTGQRISPIQSLPGALAPMELHNSPLSEIACLGFEYGYSMEAPEALVLWEAQFGDFVNSAQVIIDQFIVSALSKWGQTTRLTLLLPHGYEGSGPEHSSGRLERFLTLAAEGNIRVANLTTPAQYFHLLRRQARVAKQRPLVIMTPKSLLRLPQATSRIEHLADSRFFPVLAEPRVDVDKVTRLVLCTGKLFYDLKGHATRENNEGVAITRVELLYPFPQAQILEEVKRYPNLREVVWAQEEPRNMGARAHMSPRLLQILPTDIEFGYVGRPERASPGEGYPAAHTVEQTRIIRTALDLSVPVSVNPKKMPGER
ncbi:MAG TPA: multifunctional oxoglutarate decarboxylase/oxoglutarate dehydrogenase thiamine pyrophosphate-binding subunit/dihydrolipoyllysine-residue succinyltransferase subunit [Solirubrobacter sp.]